MASADRVLLIISRLNNQSKPYRGEKRHPHKDVRCGWAAGGPVVDEKALIEALKNGEIHAAGLDVFEQEPLPVDSPLLTMPNVVALPHIGSATHETRYNMAATAVDNLIAALSGKVERNCVNPQVQR